MRSAVTTKARRYMAKDDPDDLSDAAIVGHALSANILWKLIEREIISPGDAVEIADRALYDLEEWQGHHPDLKIYFENARTYLSKLIDDFRAIEKNSSG